MSFVGKAIGGIVSGVGSALGIGGGGGGGNRSWPELIAALHAQNMSGTTAPTVANNSSQLDAQALAAQKAMMGGRTSTMLTGGAGFEEDPKNTSKILLGQ